MSETATFRGLILDETEGGVAAEIREIPVGSLPEGDVVVDVRYSDLNYKDGMILKGLGKLVRHYPHVPGVDFAGVVAQSESPRFKPGDPVILTGWRVGEVRWGGFATRARVKADWLVPLPDGMTLQQSMALGTAGLTAMLAIMALEAGGLRPENKGEVLITGAAGGVGSVACALLGQAGYRVAAVTGRPEAADYLRELGATTIVGRDEVSAAPKGPLGPERWSGAIDNVGGAALGNILSHLCYWATCASVGNAGGIAFNATVLPFLLRGIRLVGIDSATCPLEQRLIAWERLARELPMALLDTMTEVVPLAALPALADTILKGQVRGRTVVDVHA